MCNRCGGLLQSDTPRDTFEGGTYHIYCGWKLRRKKEEQEAVYNVGEQDANQVHQERRGDDDILGGGAKDGSYNPQGNLPE